jgi:hypothetical protein
MEDNKQDNDLVREDKINLDVEQPDVDITPEETSATEQGEAEITPVNEDLVNETPAPVVVHATPKSKKLIIALVVLLAVLLAVVGVVLAKTLSTESDKQTAKSTVEKPKKLMGAELTIADVYIQTGDDNKTWQDAKAGDQIAEMTYIRTQPSARAVITLDDGSAIRVNSGSVVKIDSLDPNNVVVTNVSGEVYTRVVPSERSFSVVVADEEYEALGTAYKTVNTAEIKGVEVYQSTVKLVKGDVSVTEGKYYYADAADANVKQKLSDIPVEKVKADAFLAWNYEQDKQNSEFKDKLGYLTKIDEPVEQPKPAATKPVSQNTAASIQLSGKAYDTGVKLSWTLKNVSAPNGLKIVKGTAANPTYGKNDAVFVKAGTTSYAWKLKDGQTYHFRVCVYSDGACSLYSNNVTVTAPVYTEPQPTGSLSLTGTGGKDVSWVLNGSSPKGYKLVWSTSPNPVYPGNDYNYYSDPKTMSGSINPGVDGTYYVRVCMYTGSGCTNYSNEITIVLSSTIRR